MPYVFVIALLFVTNCAIRIPVGSWIRTDGQQITGDPELRTKLELDSAYCFGQTEKITGPPVARDIAVAEFAKSCMDERGYLFKPG